MISVGGLVASAAFIGCAGCILVVDSASGDGFSTTCGFTSADTDCGQCIQTSCQTTLDACCADSACVGSLGAIDHCAGGDCTALETDTNPAFSDVTTCAMTSCANVCSFTLPQASTCTTDLVGAGLVCACTIPQGSSGNTTSCVPPKDGLCCADAGWPAGATGCECIAPVCSTYSNACICEQSTLNGSANFVLSCKSTHCCEQTDGSCRCSTDACFPEAIEVPECTPANVTCGSQARVPRCSR